MLIPKNVIKYVCLIIATLFILTPQNTEAQNKKKKKKKNDTEVVLNLSKKPKKKA